MNVNENQVTSMSQNSRIADYLLQGNSITPIDALNLFGCFRLGARIADIKERYGWQIESNRVTTPTGKRVASYKLAMDSVRKGGAE